MPKRIDFYKSIFKYKNTLKVSTAILLLLICPYLIYNNIYYKKTIVDNNTQQSEDNFKKEYYGANDKNKTQTTRSFDKANLVNDNRGVPVLYYHSVREPADNEVTITPKMLRTQLEYIKNQGYIALTVSELKNYLLNDSPIPEKSIVITFDDGYMDNYYNAFPILKDLNMVATIFCITSSLNGSYYLSKEAINEMSNYGIDIESHTVSHHKLNQMTYDEQLTELKESKNTLESITGKEVDSLAYPFVDFNDDSIKAARTAGYTLAFTTKRGLSDRDDNPLKLDRIYISSKYDMNTFKEVLTKTEK
jgi:peptidoglycan/xylan/chitin deacetylase (PgdA/CDA1 family)